MAHHNVLLPEEIQYGSIVGSGFNTVSHETASGHQTRNARQSQARHKFRLIKALQSSAEARVLKTFALNRRGGLHSFLIIDVLDNSTATDWISAPSALDVTIGAGDGTRTTFPLIKTYGAADPNPYVRTLTCPKTDSVLVAINGTPTTAYTLVNGKVVFDTAPAALDIITAGCFFYVPVAFTLDVDAWAGLQADEFDSWSSVDLGCEEVLDETEYPELRWPGGETAWGSTAYDIELSWADGELHTVTPTANIDAVLPEPGSMPGGPRVFVVANLAPSTYTVQLRDSNGSAVGSAIAAATTKSVWLSNVDGTAIWGVY